MMAAAVLPRFGQRAALAVLCFVCALLMAGKAAAEPAPWQPKDGQQLYFDITRNGDKFGHHILNFRRTGDKMEVVSDVLLRAGIGPLTLFEYKLASTETYANGALQSVTARTLNNGKWRPMTANAAVGGLFIKGEKFNGLVQGVVSPSSHWNIAEMKQKVMVELESGKPMPITVTDLGMDKVKTAKGEVSARRFRVQSDITADFWYDDQNRWVKCAFTTQGSKIEYTLRDLPA
jgi:hypothetical protein